jgi:hypothetical protein
VTGPGARRSPAARRTVRRLASAARRRGARGAARPALAGLLSILTLAAPTVRAGQNQAFVPVHEGAAEALERADLAWVERQADPAALARAAEACYEALASSATGDLVPRRPFPPPEGSAPSSAPRTFEGVEAAVLRRLHDAELRAAWQIRFAEPAVQSLGSGSGGDAWLASVERRFPTTPAAARAALRLGDRAHAAAAPRAAGTWYERAEVHGRWLGDGALTAAIARRRASLAPAPQREPQATLALRLEPRDRIPLEDPAGPGPAYPTVQRGSGLRPGLVVLADGRVAVQTASRVHLVDLDRGAVTAVFEPGSLRALLLVDGRAAPARARSNRLLCVEPPARRLYFDSDPSPRETLPTLRFALGDPWVDAAAESRGSRELAATLAGAEFQPGPLLGEELALAQLRVGSGEIEAHLLAAEARSGAVRWRRFLGKGSELDEDAGRFAGVQGYAGAAAPLLDCGLRVFVGTELGIGALLDQLDGRLQWLVLGDRRRPRERGFKSQRAVLAEGGLSLLYAPADGGLLYWLPNGPLDPTRTDPFLAPPRGIGAGVGLEGALGGDDPAALVTLDAGQRQALGAWDLRRGARLESVHLFPSEPLRSGAAVGPDFVAASSDRALYLFDPRRELALAARAPLPRGSPADADRWAFGGSVHAAGGHLLVLGHDHLLPFALE